MCNFTNKLTYLSAQYLKQQEQKGHSAFRMLYHPENKIKMTVKRDKSVTIDSTFWLDTVTGRAIHCKLIAMFKFVTSLLQIMLQQNS